MQVLNIKFQGNPSCSHMHVVRRTNTMKVTAAFLGYVHAPKMCNKHLDRPSDSTEQRARMTPLLTGK
jgi:hypothetical protein